MAEGKRWIFYNNLEDAIKNIKIDGRRIKYCSDELQKNYDLCMMAVKQNGLAIEFLPDRMKSEPQIMLAAVKQNSFAFCLLKDVLSYYKNDPNTDQKLVNKLNKILAVGVFRNDPNFDKHCDLMYSKMYRDKSWEDRALYDYNMYRHLDNWEKAGRPLDESFSKELNSLPLQNKKKVSQMEI